MKGMYSLATTVIAVMLGNVLRIEAVAAAVTEVVGEAGIVTSVPV